MTENPQSSTAVAAPRPVATSLQGRVVDLVAAQLTQGITPEKVALTLAVGSALGLFPILGTTTLLCLAAGIVLRLNQPVIQMVNALCTPFHLPVIYCMFRLGNWLFALPNEKLRIGMMHMLWEDPREFFEKFGMSAVHAIAAWAVVAPFWILTVYMVGLPVLREALRRKGLANCGGLPPPEHPVP
ncbi:MAG TPA: DUF2062 domain-containing protein [Opitutaceae bacterium]|nr:DUF2062 domain-containing protein [Opitutaceae bacterium]